MTKKTSNIKKEVYLHFKKFQIVFLATSEKNQPRVRPVTLAYINKKFWFTADANSAKIKQIMKNNKIEFCLFLENETNPYAGGYIRCAGISKIIKNKEIKGKIGKRCGVFGRYFQGPEDPNYTLVEIILKEIEYLKLTEKIAEKMLL